MPWEIDAQNCIHKVGEPDPIPGGCHDTKAEAEAHVRALYANADESEKEFIPGTLAAYKSKDGNYRWVLCSSNSYEDRDKEIVSQKALEKDVERADHDGDYGNLRWWHLKSDLGPCDFNMMYGRVLVESGTFHDWRVGQRVKDHPEALEVSIGFEYPRDEPDAEGVFHNIHRFERSILPRGFASNPFTSVHLINKESGMPTQEEKEKAFAEFMQVDLATGQKMLQAAVLAENAAKESNARHKAKADDEDKKPDAMSADDKPNGTDAEADKPFPKDVAEDDEKPDDEKKGMSKKEFDAALTAVVRELEAVKAEMHILKTATAEKAQRDANTAADLNTAKETAEKAWQLAQELNGTLPRKLGDPLAAYRPSTHGKEVAASDTRLKQAQPDPWEKHLNAIFPAATPFVPPGN